jgi:hypothetical protein
MKADELRKYAVCSMCLKKLGASGMPLFYKVTIERFGIDLGAMTRQGGLEQLIGNARIAQAMGADEEMTVHATGADRALDLRAVLDQFPAAVSDRGAGRATERRRGVSICSHGWNSDDCVFCVSSGASLPAAPREFPRGRITDEWLAVYEKNGRECTYAEVQVMARELIGRRAADKPKGG